MGGGRNGNFGNTRGSRRSTLPSAPSQLKHIFGARKGHLTDTPAHRKLLIDTANNDKYYRGTDKYGNQWHTFIDSKGRQVWTRSQNGVINEGGRNNMPLKWDNETGLNKNPIKREWLLKKKKGK